MEVGLAVGGRVASTIISKLVNELFEYAKDEKKMQRRLKDELARLENALPKIQAVLNGVDQGLIREKNPPLEKWLWQLRDAADQADDVMDEIKYNYEKERVETEKTKVNKAITNFQTFFLRAVDKDPFLKRLKKAVKAINKVAAHVGEFYMLSQNLDQKEMVKSAISGRETSSLMNKGAHVFGREKEKEDIIKRLLSPDCKNGNENLAILPIIGVGGVGKTTLARLVYNDPTVENHFELRLWICISNNFDEVLLTKKLYESAMKKRADFESFDLIQIELSEKLKSTRFLVVFDDAWNDNNKEGWDKLITPLMYGKSGSMMLLTTRMKTVVGLTGPNRMDSIILEGLNECVMWDLFKECAFGGEDPNNNEELVKIGRGIMKKLKGSPLAAKTVGGILCSHLNEVHWTSILESEIWHLEQGQNDIMPALRLTYQYLPSHLKPCFSFCSIFPQDHVFHKHDLINMWITLGMVHQSVNGTIRLEDEGSKYFDNMLSKSIFIRSNSGEEFVMHDLIHDLSVFVSEGECLTTITNKRVSIPKTVRHLYAHIDAHIDGSLDLINEISGLKNLRTLVLHFDQSDYSNQNSLVAEMLKGMKSLRLLRLIAHRFSEFPESASTLLHLRYLSISSSRISAFPESMTSLYLLEIMVYNGTSQLRQADALGKLINLKGLTIKSYDGFGLPPTWFKTQPLSKLVRIKIHGLNFVHFHSLELLPHLKYIDFDCMNAIEDIIHECNQSSTIDAFPSLEELSFSSMSAIKEWRLTKQPNKWMQCLRKLKISECRKLQVLPPVPVGVKELRFENLGLNALPNLWNAQSNKSALVIIKILHCENLISLNEGLIQNPERFVALKKLSISSCNKLMNLPPGGFNNFISLKELNLCYCSNIQVEEFFLPSTLQKLSIFGSADSLVTNLPKALESVHSLIELELAVCGITSLPPKEVFSRWKKLKALSIIACGHLASLESLLGLSSIEYLEVCACPKLSPVQPPSPSSTMETGNTCAQEKPLLSVDNLEIDDPLLLSVEPMKSLSARKLTIEDCSKLQSLPELPPFVQELYLERCSRELQKRCEKSGPDWPKLSQIPKVEFLKLLRN